MRRCGCMRLPTPYRGLLQPPSTATSTPREASAARPAARARGRGRRAARTSARVISSASDLLVTDRIHTERRRRSRCPPSATALLPGCTQYTSRGWANTRTETSGMPRVRPQRAPPPTAQPAAAQYGPRQMAPVPTAMSKKRTLDGFFKPLSRSPQYGHHQQRPADAHPSASITTAENRHAAENGRVTGPRPRLDQLLSPAHDPPSAHPTYPCPIPQLPPLVASALSSPSSCPAAPARAIDDQPFLDLAYFQPFIPGPVADALFRFLRASLPFYRVRYRIQRGGIDTVVNTPRFTTVFGVDETACFRSPAVGPLSSGNRSSSVILGDDAGDAASTAVLQLVDRKTEKPVLPKDGRYKCHPRPLPACLDTLRVVTERATGETYNFCLVNYYASGDDSISFHSDDERFLGTHPAIASLSLGAKRDFVMKRKPLVAAPKTVCSGAVGSGGGNAGIEKGQEAKPLKLPLSSGDMVLMRGKTQANWLHSIPKRKGSESGKGRINITFRKAMVRGGTENYYQYNVGVGPVYTWNEKKGEMMQLEDIEAKKSDYGEEKKAQEVTKVNIT